MKKILFGLLAALSVVFLTAGVANYAPESLRSPHGVLDNTGNEQTLQYLYNLKNIPIYVNGPTYYFSDDGDALGDFGQGDDTNSGLRPDDPFTSWWKLQEVCPQANCILDAGDSQWMTFEDCADANSSANGEQPQAGVAVADGICDVDALTTAGDPEIDQDTNVGSTDTRPWMRISSSRPGTPVIIDETDAPSGWLMHAYGGGTVILQDITFSSFTTDVLVVDDDTNLIANNVRCTGLTGATDRCFRIAGGNSVVLNSEADGADGEVVLVSEDGKLTFISQKTLAKTSRDDANEPIVYVSPSETAGGGLTMIGPVLRASGAGANATRLVFSAPTAGYPVKMRFARTHFVGSDNASVGGAILYKVDDDEYTDLEVYQSTFNYTWPALYMSSATGSVGMSNALTRIIAKYNVFQTEDGGATSEYGVWANLGGFFQSGTFSVRDSIVNEASDSQTNMFSMRDDANALSNDTSVADAIAEIATWDATAQSVLADFFANGITATDTDQYGGTCVATPGTAGAKNICVCDPAQACYDAMTTTYTIELLAPIPGEIVGSPVDIQYLVLGDVNTNYGAY